LCALLNDEPPSRCSRPVFRPTLLQDPVGFLGDSTPLVVPGTREGQEERPLIGRARIDATKVPAIRTAPARGGQSVCIRLTGRKLWRSTGRTRACGRPRHAPKQPTTRHPQPIRDTTRVRPPTSTAERHSASLSAAQKRCLACGSMISGTATRPTLAHWRASQRGTGTARAFDDQRHPRPLFTRQCDHQEDAAARIDAGFQGAKIGSGGVE
jgi:hypothetical protein